MLKTIASITAALASLTLFASVTIGGLLVTRSSLLGYEVIGPSVHVLDLEDAAAVEGELLPRLEALGRKGVEVPGLGKVAYVAATMTQGLDVRAAEALLVAASIELPLKLTERRAGLRATLNV